MGLCESDEHLQAHKRWFRPARALDRRSVRFKVARLVWEWIHHCYCEGKHGKRRGQVQLCLICVHGDAITTNVTAPEYREDEQAWQKSWSPTPVRGTKHLRLLGLQLPFLERRRRASAHSAYVSEQKCAEVRRLFDGSPAVFGRGRRPRSKFRSSVRFCKSGVSGL